MNIEQIISYRQMIIYSVYCILFFFPRRDLKLFSK